jgi:hypothetical protein
MQMVNCNSPPISIRTSTHFKTGRAGGFGCGIRVWLSGLFPKPIFADHLLAFDVDRASQTWSSSLHLQKPARLWGIPLQFRFFWTDAIRCAG